LLVDINYISLVTYEVIQLLIPNEKNIFALSKVIETIANISGR